MTIDPAHVGHARKVADAVLYEGYLLYPYRPSAQKNQVRFQFGVLMPPAYLETDASERSASQTECLAECADDARVQIWLRFLHLQRRQIEAAGPWGGGGRAVDRLRVGDTEFTTWDEAAEREEFVSVAVSSLLGAGTRIPFRSGPAETREEIGGEDGGTAGWIVRSQAAAEGQLVVRAERVAGPYRALKLVARVENHTPLPAPPQRREEALGHALIAAHLLIGLPGGAFLSLTDPPEWAAGEAAECTNEGTWPALAGPEGCRDLVLSAPVILGDHPGVAPESAGDLFDATEIDEILTLRTLALTDTEKQEARAGDPLAASLLDRLDGLPPQMLERMHGAIRYLRQTGPGQPGTPPSGQPASPAAGPPASGAQPPGGAAAPGRQEPAPNGEQAVPAPGEQAVPAPGEQAVPAPGEQAVPAASQPGSWAAELGHHAAASGEQVPWWDPGADSSVAPETDHVIVAGTPVARGSRVLMRPGARRADAQDLFLTGREALVEAVFQDVDGQVHVAVSPVSDPAAELQRGHGRFLYFAPDEIEPIHSGSFSHEEDPP
jgi:hypothetical protein